ADGLRAVVAGGGTDDGGAAGGQLVGDGRADAAAGTGNKGDLAAQGQVAHVDSWFVFSGGRAAAPRRSAPVGQRGVEVRGCADGARVQRLVDALGQAGQHLAGPALGDVGGATTGQGLDATGPAYRQVELAHQRVADRLDAVVDLGVDVLHHRQRRRLPLQAGHRLAQAIEIGRAHV